MRRVKGQEVQQLRVFPRMEGHGYRLPSCWCSAQMSVCTLCMNCTWMLACEVPVVTAQPTQ